MRCTGILTAAHNNGVPQHPDQPTAGERAITFVLAPEICSGCSVRSPWMSQCTRGYQSSTRADRINVECFTASTRSHENCPWPIHGSRHYIFLEARDMDVPFSTHWCVDATTPATPVDLTVSSGGETDNFTAQNMCAKAHQCSGVQRARRERKRRHPKGSDSVTAD